MADRDTAAAPVEGLSLEERFRLFAALPPGTAQMNLTREDALTVTRALGAEARMLRDLEALRTMTNESLQLLDEGMSSLLEARSRLIAAQRRLIFWLWALVFVLAWWGFLAQPMMRWLQ
jgi:hypothetical protein